jgi:hypothetical protein
MRAILLVLAVCLTPCLSTAADPKWSDTLPENVIRSWEEAEAQFVWIGPTKYRFLWFEDRRDDLGAQAVPGFWFKS